MDIAWILEQLSAAPTRAGLWLASSILLAGFTSGLARLFAPGLERTVRVVRWVSLPYLGLVVGDLSPRSMGVSYLDWSLGLRVGLVVLAGMLALLVIVRIWLHSERGLPPVERSAGPFSLMMWIESSAQEFHWCFLRGASLDLLISFPAPDQVVQYWSTWLGAALAVPGVILHSRGQLKSPDFSGNPVVDDQPFSVYAQLLVVVAASCRHSRGSAVAATAGTAATSAQLMDRAAASTGRIPPPASGQTERPKRRAAVSGR